jgi:hypothetical protein
MFFHQYKLPGNILKCSVFLEQHGVFGVEGLSHVQAIEPHLPWINLFVPKAAITGARMMLQLAAQQVGGFFIFGFFCNAITKQ